MTYLEQIKASNMALFFKRIRQKLLIRKRFGKYTLYALGEVLIVIVGILVAVQVNSWNEDRKDEAVEISILKAIKADLVKDSINLKGDMNTHEQGIVSSFIIQNHLEMDRPYNDSLANHFIAAFYVTDWMYNSGGIQTLKSLGVNTITNEEIRSEIIYLYDVQYSFLMYLTERLNDSYAEGEQNILRTRFEEAKLFGDYGKSELFDYEMAQKVWERSDERMVPLDYEALKKDNAYMFHLKTHLNGGYFYLIMSANTKVMITQLILNIEEEINRLEA